VVSVVPHGRPTLLLIDAIAPLTSFGLEVLNRVPGLLHRARHGPADGTPLPTNGLHDPGDGGTALALQHWRPPERSCRPRAAAPVVLATSLALGVFSAAVAFLAAFSLAGWPYVGSGVPAFVPAFVVTGSPSPWIHAQIRLIAVFRSVN